MRVSEVSTANSIDRWRGRQQLWAARSVTSIEGACAAAMATLAGVEL